MDQEHKQQESSTLLNVLVTVAEQKKTVLAITVAVTIAATLIAFLLPPWYTATVKMLPPQQSQSNAVAILGQLGVLTGASQALGLKNPSDVYVAILKSRTVADRLIDRFQLKTVYGQEYLLETRRELARNSSIAASRDGIITIDIDDRDAKRAADLANAYIEELRGLTVHLAVSEAGQRRLFFEGQLKKAKTDLSNAEEVLQKYTRDAGLINPQGQIGLSVAASAALRAQITAKEIQLSAMRSFATEDNPDLKRTLGELAGLRVELRKMERNANEEKGDVLVPFGKASEVGLEYVRRYRDVRYFETLYEVLAKQYEIARIDEAKDATLIQVLDAAVVPERRYRPKRALIVTISAVFALILAIAFVLLRDSLRDTGTNVGSKSQLRALLTHLKRW